MQIFNDKKKRIGTLSGFKNQEITTTLDSGDKELSFSYPTAGALVDLLKEEYYIRTKRTNMSSKRLKRESSSTNTQQSSMSRSWRNAVPVWF